jgi:hypothetical protein
MNLMNRLNTNEFSALAKLLLPLIGDIAIALFVVVVES